MQNSFKKILTTLPFLKAKNLDNTTVDIIANAASLIGTVGSTAALGFIYWWLAARLFTVHEVGFASAAISTMILLGTISMLGLGTLLVGELPKHPHMTSTLLAISVVLSGSVAAVTGIVFALLAPYLSPDLAPLAASSLNIFLFALGVALTAITMVIDQALIGLMRGTLQFWRNMLFSVAKLILLAIVGTYFADIFSLPIYMTWIASLLLSFAVLWNFVRHDMPVAKNSHKFSWGDFLGMFKAAIGHHALNLTLEATPRLLPLLVTITLSARLTASFYVAWMIVGLIFIGADALTLVLYAVGSREPEMLIERIRLTLILALIFGFLATLCLFPISGWLLGLFGGLYSEEATWCLRIISLGTFPLIVKTHYVAIQRISGRTRTAAIVTGVGSLFEIMFAAVGAISTNGLTGLAIGWVLATVLQAVYMSGFVIRSTISKVEEKSSLI